MRRLFAMVFGVLLGAAAMFVAFKFHIVRTKDDWVFVPKPHAALVDAYVDVREWDTAEWTKHTQLIKALVRIERADLVRQAVTDRWQDKVLGKRRANDDSADERSADEAALDFPPLERE